MGWVVSSTSRLHFTLGKDPVPILQEAGWAPGRVCKGEKSRPHWDSIPDRPARSQSLCRLSYPAHSIIYIYIYIYVCILYYIYIERERERETLCIGKNLVITVTCKEMFLKARKFDFIWHHPTGHSCCFTNGFRFRGYLGLVRFICDLIQYLQENAPITDQHRPRPFYSISCKFVIYVSSRHKTMYI